VETCWIRGSWFTGRAVGVGNGFVQPNEVFDVEEVGELFIAYFRTGDVPSGAKPSEDDGARPPLPVGWPTTGCATDL
jgi:hypothetical protein